VVVLDNPKIRGLFQGVCDNQADTVPTTIIEEDMKLELKHSQESLTSEEYLKNFCSPYVYTRINLNVCLW
jgi:hypothetical protein